MKLSNAILMLALAGVITACGKDNSSGGGSSSNSSNVGIVGNPNLSQTSTQALNNFRTWYNSSSEASTNPGVYELSYSNGNTGGGSSDNCRTYLSGFLQFCSGFYSSTSTFSSIAPTCKVVVRTQTSSSTNLKSQNKILSDIAAGRAGTLVSAAQSGTVFQLQFQAQSGAVATYLIDTRYHSAFQPIAYATGSTLSNLSNVRRNDFSTLRDCE